MDTLAGIRKLLVTICVISNFRMGSDASLWKDIEFSVKDLPKDPNYLPKYRIEHAERNTSKEYDYWKQMDINLIEWPGNITKLEVERPLLQWGKRAKLIQSPCNVVLGMDFKAYAYKYLHLTWGKFRMTSSYCPPLKIPRESFLGHLPAATRNSQFISATDFEFVSDALLIIVESQLIIRVGELEAAHRNEGSPEVPDPASLSYTLATGLTLPVTKLVTQNCCKHRMTKTCVNGDIVMSFNERSLEPFVFISSDTGKTFHKVVLHPFLSPILHSAIIFPGLELIAVLQGNNHAANISHYSLASGELIKPKAKNRNESTLQVRGTLQAKQIGEEYSILVWDECTVWYSTDAGLNFSEALFYVHSDIEQGLPEKDEPKRSKESKHRISRQHCHLGGQSGYYQDLATGKVAILDSVNNFFYGIDTKSNQFPLIGANVDMSLLLPDKVHSIAPFFDFNNRPKLMYPPRFLESDDEAYKDKNYKNRLGIRLFPRSIFPSDFMAPFFEENIPKRFRREFGLKKCQTSSIIIDSSLSQKPKIFYTFENTPFNFTVEFKSNRNESKQLKWTPNEDKNLRISSRLENFMRLGVKDYYYFKYILTVLPKPSAFEGSLFRLNFFTVKLVRCVHQPQVTVWIQLENQDSSNKRSKTPLTVIGDPEPVKKLRNFLNGSEVRKALHDKNPINIQQCSKTL